MFLKHPATPFVEHQIEMIGTACKWPFGLSPVLEELGREVCKSLQS